MISVNAFFDEMEKIATEYTANEKTYIRASTLGGAIGAPIGVYISPGSKRVFGKHRPAYAALGAASGALGSNLGARYNVKKWRKQREKK